MTAAEELVVDLEQRRDTDRQLALEADRRGDHKLANVHSIRADVYAITIALVVDRLPRIITEAQREREAALVAAGELVL